MDVTDQRRGTSVAASDWTRLTTWIVLLAGGVFLLMVGGNFTLVREVAAKIVLQVLALGILTVWVAGTVVRSSWRPSTPLFIPVLVGASAYVLSGLLSQRPRLSLEPTMGALGFALAFLMLTKLLADPWFRARVSAALKLTVALVAIGYVAQVLIEWISWWQLIGKIAVPPLRPSWVSLFFGSPNDIPAFLFIAGPLSVVLIRQGTARHWLSWLVGGLGLIAVVLSGSRGGYLGVGVGVVVALGLIGAGLRTQTSKPLVVDHFRAHPWRVLVVASATLAVAAIIPAVAYRFAQGGDEVRFDLWRSALTIFAQHPIAGGGPGTWVQLKIGANPIGAPNNVFSDAHSTYFQAAAEFGIVGLIGFTYIVFAVVWRLAQARSSEGAIGRQASAVIVGLSALAAQCLVANLLSLPFVGLLLVVVVAWVDAGIPNTASEGPISSRPAVRLVTRGLPIGGLAGIVLAVSMYIPIDVATLQDAAGNDAAWNQDWAEALNHYEEARRLDPTFTLYDLRAASALARLGRLGEARELLTRATQADPLPAHQVGLAALNAAMGNRSAALDGARRAVAMSAGDPMVSLNAGLIAESAGDAAFAVDQFAAAIVANPPLARLDMWAAPTRIVSKDLVIATAVARSEPPEAGLILAYAGRTDEAKGILERIQPSGVRETYLAVSQWLAGDTPAAEERLRELLQDDPLDWLAAAWLARIERLTGDQASADRYARWALTVQRDRAQGVIVERSAVPPVFDAPTTGLPASYPSGTYLRETGPYLLMPQLKLIGYR